MTYLKRTHTQSREPSETGSTEVPLHTDSEGLHNGREGSVNEEWGSEPGVMVGGGIALQAEQTDMVTSGNL